jgi:hypothetical protein
LKNPDADWIFQILPSKYVSGRSIVVYYESKCGLISSGATVKLTAFEKLCKRLDVKTMDIPDIHHNVFTVAVVSFPAILADCKNTADALRQEG